MLFLIGDCMVSETTKVNELGKKFRSNPILFALVFAFILEILYNLMRLITNSPITYADSVFNYPVWFIAGLIAFYFKKLD